MRHYLKRIASIMLLVLLMAGMIGEAMPSMAATVKTTSITLSASGTVTLNLKETLDLTATLTPAESTQKITWKSSKPRVARVSGGHVTGLRTGTTKITATSGKKKASVKVKVVDPGKPVSVSLDKTGTQSMFVGTGMQLTATLNPSTAVSGLKWKTSNKRIATVSKTGWVGALAPGKVTITVTTRNKKKAKVKIQVIDDGQRPIVPPSGYNLPYVLYACVKTHTIAAIAKDDDGNWTRVIRMWPTGTGRVKGTTDIGFWKLAKKEAWHKWGSGYSPFACKLSVGIYLHGPIYKKKNRSTIRPSYYNCIGTNCSSGCLRTVCSCAQWVYYNCDVGTYFIVAQNSRFSTPRPTKIGKKAKKDPTDPGNNVEIFMTSFSVDPGALTLSAGGVQRITPVGFAPAKTTTRSFTFASDNPAVASVDAEGNVTGVAPGSATITVTAADDYGAKVRVPVTVNGGIYSAESLFEAGSDESTDAAEAALTADDAPAADENLADAQSDAPEESASADAAETVVAADADEAGDAQADPEEEYNGLSSSAESVDEEQTEIFVDLE